jgi:hypothetical protein
MSPADWTLSVVAAADPSSLSPVQLQKTLFLLGRNLPTDTLGPTFYTFEPYDYGPFCGLVYLDAEKLAVQGLVEIDMPPSFSFRTYRATQAGKTRAMDIGLALPPGVRTYLSQVVGWVRSQSFQQLVTTIYRLYPEMKKNSVFQE